MYCRAVKVSVAFIPILDPFLRSAATKAGFWQPAVRSEPLAPLLSPLSSTAPFSTRQCTWQTITTWHYSIQTRDSSNSIIRFITLIMYRSATLYPDGFEKKTFDYQIVWITLLLINRLHYIYFINIWFKLHMNCDCKWTS